MRRLIISCTMFAAACVTWAQGLPFIKIYKGEDYHAHDLNFDVKVTDDGTLFAANFEGMLYYDNATWRILHTDGNSRITISYLDKDGVLWVGGYNFFGRVAVQENGKLYLQRAGEKNLFVGEVLDQIALTPLRDRLRYLVEKRFRGELNKCSGCKLCK